MNNSINSKSSTKNNEGHIIGRYQLIAAVITVIGGIFGIWFKSYLDNRPNKKNETTIQLQKEVVQSEYQTKVIDEKQSAIKKPLSYNKPNKKEEGIKQLNLNFTNYNFAYKYNKRYNRNGSLKINHSFGKETITINIKPNWSSKDYRQKYNRIFVVRNKIVHSEQIEQIILPSDQKNIAESSNQIELKFRLTNKEVKSGRISIPIQYLSEPNYLRLGHSRTRTIKTLNINYTVD